MIIVGSLGMPETLPLPCPVLSIGDARVTSVGNVANTSWWHMFGLPKKINHMKTHIARIFLAACTCLFFFYFSSQYLVSRYNKVVSWSI